MSLRCAVSWAWLPCLLYSVSASALEWEVHGYLKNESALFLRAHDGPLSAQAWEAGDLSKSETTAGVFVNADISADLRAHANLKFTYDPIPDAERYRGYRYSSQQDYLRELYVDYFWEGTDIRFGKQQVIWGTADGVKLLDTVNPTDYRELFQNSPEEARIPVWMLKLERPVGDDSNLQLLLAQAKANRIPGLEADGDGGQPFVSLGADSITGRYNGFLSITPALGRTALAFTGLAASFSGGRGTRLADIGGERFTVQDFIDGNSPLCPNGQPPAGMPLEASHCAALLNAIAQTPGLGGNQNQTNLVSAEFDATRPDSAFEYMPNTSFATFDTFSTARSRYERDHPSDWALNPGLRWRGLLGESFNYSLNYLYHYDPNPALSLDWEDSQGRPLTPYLSTATGDNGQAVSTLRLRRSDGTDFVAANASAENDGAATLVFRETLHRVHSLGASFDTTLDSDWLGAVVLRGELVYEHGAYRPVVDRNALAVGDISRGLHSEPTDFFKYALGMDINLLTNLLFSAQFIQFYQLDFVDEAGRYSADPMTLHLSNQLQPTRRVKNYLSLYFSKPFGEAQRGRFNNMTLLEEGGGYWNRMQWEYALSDTLIGSLEWNHYGGDVHSQLGQFYASSNLQLGIKLLFD